MPSIYTIKQTDPTSGVLGTPPGELVPGGISRISDQLKTISGLVRLWTMDGGVSSQTTGGTFPSSGNGVASDLAGNCDGLFGGQGAGFQTNALGPDTAPAAYIDALSWMTALTTTMTFPTSGGIYFWYKPSVAPVADSQLVQMASSGNFPAVAVFTRNISGGSSPSDVKLCAWFFSGNAGNLLVGPPLSANQWYEIIVLWDSLKSELFVNRQLVDTGAAPNNTSGLTAWGFSVGDSWWDTSSTSTPYSVGNGAEGVYANLAVFSTKPDPGLANPESGSITSGITTPPPYVESTGNLRSSQESVEAIFVGSPTLRVSTDTIEVVVSRSPKMRATQESIEVLYNVSTGNTYNVSATTSFTLHPSSGALVGHTYFVSATTSFMVSPTDTSRVGHQLPVSATTSFILTPTTRGYIPAIYNLSATTNLTVAGSGNAVIHNPTPYFVSATTSFTLRGTATYLDAKVLRVSASSSFSLASTAYAPTTFHVSATSHLFVSGVAVGQNSSLYVYASSGITLSWLAPLPYTFGPKYVSASTGFSIKGIDSTFANHLFNVSATTSMALSGLAKQLKSGPILVSATTNFKLSQSVTYTNPGPRFVSATTNLILRPVATFTRSAILMVSASTRMVLAGTGSENAEINVGASNTLSLSGLAKQNRDIFASATTSVGLSLRPATSNLKTISATSTITFTVSAGRVVTGTEASSGLVFTDLAQAVVWIPWRRNGLSLPAGGNLPHS